MEATTNKQYVDITNDWIGSSAFLDDSPYKILGFVEDSNNLKGLFLETNDGRRLKITAPYSGDRLIVEEFQDIPPVEKTNSESEKGESDAS